MPCLHVHRIAAHRLIDVQQPFLPHSIAQAGVVLIIILLLTLICQSWICFCNRFFSAAEAFLN